MEVVLMDPMDMSAFALTVTLVNSVMSRSITARYHTASRVTV